MLFSHPELNLYQDEASHIPDDIEALSPLRKFLPKGKDKGEISVISYRMGMDSCYSKGTDKKEVLLFYEITCKDNYYIGETVWLHKKRLRVCSKKGILQKGLIYFSYILATDSWICLLILNYRFFQHFLLCKIHKNRIRRVF